MKIIGFYILSFVGIATAAPREKRSPQFFAPNIGYGGYVPQPYFYTPNVGPLGKAMCRLMPANNSQVMGIIYFDQQTSLGPVQISGEIVNLDPGRHGLHIHEEGSTADDCAGAGPHFNPSNMKHGAPDSPNRHAGDLGNINVGSDRASRFEILDSEISLVEGNPRSVLMRSVVIHAMEDDLGRGEDEESTKTGNAGPRLACCVIEKPNYFF